MLFVVSFYIKNAVAGHYVPQLSQAIVRYNKATNGKAINLKGYMVCILFLKESSFILSKLKHRCVHNMQVGNALTDDYHDHLGQFQFMWSAGLISDETYKLLNVLCDFESFIHFSSACNEMMDVASEEMGNIDPYSIFTPSCSANASQTKWLLKRRHVSTQITYF